MSGKLKQILPYWLSPDQFYLLVFGVAALFAVWGVMMAVRPKRTMSSRIRAIQERRAQLQGEMGGPRRRKHAAPEGGMNFMRQVSMKLQLVKNLQIGKAEGLLIEAGYHSKDAILIMAFFVMALPIVLGTAGALGMKMEMFDA